MDLLLKFPKVCRTDNRRSLGSAGGRSEAQNFYFCLVSWMTSPSPLFAFLFNLAFADKSKASSPFHLPISVSFGLWNFVIFSCL